MGRMKRTARLLAVVAAGSVLTAAGVVLLFLPGPGLLLIAAGLAVLSIEFRWAERLRQRAQERFAEFRSRADWLPLQGDRKQADDESRAA